MFNQFWKFAVIGTFNALLNMGIVNLLVFITGIIKGFYFTLFAIIAFLITVIISYLGNKFWAFESATAISFKESFSFLIFASIGGIIYVSVASLLVNIIGAPALFNPKIWINISMAIAIVCSFLWNFLSYKHIIFKKRL